MKLMTQLPRMPHSTALPSKIRVHTNTRSRFSISAMTRNAPRSCCSATKAMEATMATVLVRHSTAGMKFTARERSIPGMPSSLALQ
jgi:thiamine phosphate synthase YjbQ (UPF0047 family)